jgi:hypothetical protein
MFVNAWIWIIVPIVVWFIHTFLMQVWIRLEAKHKWHKNVRTYPYFKYPLYKKVLLLGLRGALPSTTVIINFSFTLFSFLCVVFGIWATVACTDIIATIYSVVLISWLFSYNLAIFMLWLASPSF